MIEKVSSIMLESFLFFLFAKLDGIIKYHDETCNEFATFRNEDIIVIYFSAKINFQGCNLIIALNDTMEHRLLSFFFNSGS